MALQTSHTVLSLRSCSSFTKSSSFRTIDFRCSSIELSDLFYFTYCYIYPWSSYCTQSKRRSCGPFMAAKKESKDQGAGLQALICLPSYWYWIEFVHQSSTLPGVTYHYKDCICW